MLDQRKEKKNLNYYWRVAATGFSFASFGVGGVLMGGVVSPLMNLTTQDPQLRQQRNQKMIQRSFKGFSQMMQRLGVMDFHVDGLEKLENSQQELLIANHPTLIDVVLLLGLMKQTNCVVKQALWSNIFTRGPVQQAGYILNAGSAQFIEDCVQKLSQADAASLLIFPEGTRTEKGQLLNQFQRGAANIALRANRPIRPILIRCTPSTLTKNEKWYQIPSRPFQIHIKVMDAIQVSELLDDPKLSPVHVRQLNHQLHRLFTQELTKHEHTC